MRLKDYLKLRHHVLVLGKKAINFEFFLLINVLIILRISNHIVCL